MMVEKASICEMRGFEGCEGCEGFRERRMRSSCRTRPLARAAYIPRDSSLRTLHRKGGIEVNRSNDKRGVPGAVCLLF